MFPSHAATAHCTRQNLRLSVQFELRWMVGWCATLQSSARAKADHLCLTAGLSRTLLPLPSLFGSSGLENREMQLLMTLSCFRQPDGFGPPLKALHRCSVTEPLSKWIL